MAQNSQYFESNRQFWNARTAIHKDSAFYDLEGFKGGKSSLYNIELEEVGDVAGKSLLHLQCHFGMDTLSWARMGAKVTGVDLSDAAILLATQINEELGLDAKFICTNLYDLRDHLDRLFDIVFTSYGTIGWLPDLDRWAGIVSHYLKPGGIFYIADFHPVLWMLDDHFSFIKYDYFNTGVIAEENAGTYADRTAPIKMKEYGWNHPFSEIIGALIKHGLKILHLHEFPFSPANCFNNLEEGEDGYWHIKGMNDRLPMMYSIKAIKE